MRFNMADKRALSQLVDEILREVRGAHVRPLNDDSGVGYS